VIAFIERWALWRVLSILSGTIGAIGGLFFLSEPTEILTLIGLYFAFVFGVLAIHTPEQVQRPDLLRKLHELWKRANKLTQVLLLSLGVILLFSAIVFVISGFVRGKVTNVQLQPSVGRITADLPIRLTVQAPPIGQEYLDVRLQLTPVGRDGYCATPARLEFTPILDDQLRASATQTVRNDELATLDIDGSFDRAAIQVTMRTMPGCETNFALKEAAYRD